MMEGFTSLNYQIFKSLVLVSKQQTPHQMTKGLI